MYQHRTINGLNDFFTELNNRQNSGVYFYRINGYNQQIDEFIKKYYQIARKTGIIVEGKIENPTDANLEYYNEIMGMAFQLSMDFIDAGLKKWLPRLNQLQRQTLTSAIYIYLQSLAGSGKTENMLKNAYIKFMCWLYYKFERILNQLGNNNVPKVLYEGNVSNYELMLLSVLSNAGCDVVLLQYNGDSNYLKIDPKSSVSTELKMAGMTAFPADFNLKKVRKEIESTPNPQMMGVKPKLTNCTNAWIKGNGFDDILVRPNKRGTDPNLFYNCFIRFNGAEDKLYYTEKLFKLQQELSVTRKNLLIIDNSIPSPTVEEVGQINRNLYPSPVAMLASLSNNLKYISNLELQKLIINALYEVIMEESKNPENNLNKLTNKTIYLVCWIKRYYAKLFSGWKEPDIGCFIFFGGCKTSSEALFLKLLSRLPLDVLVFVPDLSETCYLSDSKLYDINYDHSLQLTQYPRDSVGMQMATAAYTAERELDSIMYNDTGIYRNRQYGKATAVTLKTSFEEIDILWDQELKYRTGFSTTSESVTIPAIFAKVCGVKDGNVQKYWSDMKRMFTPETYVVGNIPFVNVQQFNPMRQFVAEFFKNGKLQYNAIKSHRAYQYSYLREETQDYILGKLQMLIDSKIIRGTFETGMEYNIVSLILNMDKEILRLIQNFDFTKKNPKLIYIYTTEAPIPIEDSIMLAFLNLIGFDIVIFVPTGYQSVEKNFTKQIIEEHQLGNYVYDLRVPDFRRVVATKDEPQAGSWRRKFFKRGS